MIYGLSEIIFDLCGPSNAMKFACSLIKPSECANAVAHLPPFPHIDPGKPSEL